MTRTAKILHALLLGSLLSPAAASARSVQVNGVPLRDEQLQALERAYQIGIAEGRYWYDPRTGAWGLQGGPQMGLIVPGLDLGGPLRPDASGGGTGVFVNGRELHPLDVRFWQQFTVVVPGRYWVDAYGNGGYEGGPAVFNLLMLVRQAQGGSAGGPWSYYKDYGGGSTSLISDGQGGFYFSGHDSGTGTTTTWSSGP